MESQANTEEHGTKVPVRTFRYLTDEERAALTEEERYAYDECCSNQPKESK